MTGANAMAEPSALVKAVWCSADTNMSAVDKEMERRSRSRRREEKRQEKFTYSCTEWSPRRKRSLRLPGNPAGETHTDTAGRVEMKESKGKQAATAYINTGPEVGSVAEVEAACSADTLRGAVGGQGGILSD
jgi:hypothetical protein